MIIGCVSNPRTSRREPGDRRLLRLEKYDAPCIVGSEVDRDNGCPLFRFEPTVGSNVILLGPPCVGKTHLAVSFAEAAIRAGQAAYFMTAHDLVDDLGRAYREGRLQRRMKVYLAPRVLIIDEMGYLPLDEMGATIFFQLVSARYERGSIILTSNKSYGDWGGIFGDPIIATAILDRLLHHSTTINIRGESYRLKDCRRAGLLGRPEGQPESGAEAMATAAQKVAGKRSRS